jgi:hypothetical protein
MGEDGYRELFNERQRLFPILVEGMNKIAADFNERILPSTNNSISIAMTVNSLYESNDSRDMTVLNTDDQPLPSNSNGGNVTEVSELSNDLLHPSSALDTLIHDHSSGVLNPSDLPVGHTREISPSFFGSMLFRRNVSGCRVVDCSSGKSKSIEGYSFLHWGSHYNDWNVHLNSYRNTDTERIHCQAYLTAACAIGATESEIQLYLKRLRDNFAKITKKKGIKTQIGSRKC